jgi:uncharacterized membrane protein
MNQPRDSMLIRSKNWIISSKSEYFILAAITLLAFALRFYKLGEWSFWVDEIITITSTNYLHEWPLPRLPIYLVMIRSALEFFGTNEWSARFFPALIGVISIPLLYIPIRRLFSPTVALLAVLLLTISPWHIYWSQSARFYTLLLLFYSAGSLLFFLGYEKSKVFYIIASVAFFVLVIRERISGFFFVPVILSYILFTRNIQLSLRRHSSLKTLAFIAFPVFLYAGYDLFRVFLLGEDSYFFFFLDLFVREPNQGPLRLLLAIIYRIGIPMISLGFIGGVYLTIQNHRAGLFVFLSAVIPPLLLLVFSNFMFTVDRYIFISLPYWAILTAYAVYSMFTQTAGFHKLLSIGVIALVLITYIGENVLYFGDQKGNRSNWKEAYNYIHENKMAGDMIASTRPEIGEYYLDDRIVWLNHLNPNTLQQTSDRVWFMIDEDSGYVNPGLHNWILENASLSEVVEVYIPGKSLNIRIYEYNPGG